MYRYAKEGLILCPAYECYTGKEESYYIHMHRALANIVALLKSKDITPCMFASDEIANIEDPEGVKWYQTFTSGDKQFIKKYCSCINVNRSDFATVPELYQTALKKYPMGQIANPDIMFEGVLKRTEKIERELLKTFKVIFSIQTKNNAYINIKPKADSGIIFVSITNGSFIPTSYIGDMEINPIELLDYEMGNKPVYDWRF